jgi:hypothetical protein
MNTLKLEQGISYIFKDRYVSTVYKGKVLDITETTYLIEWELRSKQRYLKDDFNYKYQAIESLQLEINKLIRMTNTR